jgi:rhomboid protease GluP
MNTRPPETQPQDIGTPKPAQNGQIFRPWVTYALIGVSVLIYALQALTQATQGVDLLELYGAKINEAIIAGEIWRLVTPIFLHVSIIHILFNMYFLYVIGPAMEHYYGATRYLLLYFLAGISGNVMSFYLSPNPSMGASTALFGLVAAQGVFIYRNRAFFGDRARGMLRNTLFLVVVNLLIGLTPGIDDWGHVGGLLGGLAFAWACGPLLKVNWLPGGGYHVEDQNLNPRMWVFGVVELVVLAGLVVLKIATAIN